jgi:hypothetical protein
VSALPFCPSLAELHCVNLSRAFDTAHLLGRVTKPQQLFVGHLSQPFAKKLNFTFRV